MSKGDGQKIAIKFDKPLLGDVSGNESAFTITGMVRNPLGVGELEQKQFAVDKIERVEAVISGTTNVNGEVEFEIDNRTYEWIADKIQYSTESGSFSNVDGDIVIHITLIKSQLPEIEGQILWLDASVNESILTLTIPQTIGGLILNLNLDDGGGVE